MVEEERITRHKIGQTRTIQTAILVCEYLKQKCCYPQSKVHPDAVIYEFIKPTADNGFWSAVILVQSNGMDLETSRIFVDTCRAFVAGRGEVWA